VTRAPRSVERTFFIRAPATRVFRAISEPRGLSRWLVERASIQLRKGGSYEFEFEGGWIHRGTVLGIKPGKQLTLSWEWKGVPLRGTVFTLAVSPRRGGSLLTLKHTGFPRQEKWVDLYGVTEWGWTYYGMNLKSVLERGRDLRSNLDG